MTYVCVPDLEVIILSMGEEDVIKISTFCGTKPENMHNRFKFESLNIREIQNKEEQKYRRPSQFISHNQHFLSMYTIMH